MTVQDLVGEFAINGQNQDATQQPYQGKLKLQLDQYQRIIAHWQIGDDQIQHGTGFYKDQILVINFNYSNERHQVFKGVVVYKCITKDVLDGFWSEKHGDPRFLGTEQAFRISSKELLH
ncbi:hypothetical protein LX97_02143 [Nonlabens dokdonensis]|jgi:hypothetical protein|uniref:Uncharacterized protein n=2 Tax=Nonlabens dokdonensis TaxID=328515 RepID=L7WFJ2_NONDD|nr:hypothetical protein [Nonlabens dokdonensis]AGC77673.1 hypothetical protein DDD_2546 [Nonlabens dokdonensis DSW-6]PZX39786.1 hypothetical protein LX97_02143 [Nonlabens dokdonensis]